MISRMFVTINSLEGTPGQQHDAVKQKRLAGIRKDPKVRRGYFRLPGFMMWFKSLSDTRTMLSLATSLALGGFLLGYELHDFTWFSRSGSLVVSVGITLLARATIVHEDIQGHVIQEQTGLSHLNPEHYKQLKEPIPEWVRLNKRTRSAVGVWGPLTTFIGTIIWGFGDLLNNLLL
jgi:hypothetical protein